MATKQQDKACPQCGQTHDKELDNMTDLAVLMAESFTTVAFPELWKDAKEDIKQMSKHELAKEMFYTGAVQMLTAFLSTMHDIPNFPKKK
jgi:hypothetical protein